MTSLHILLVVGPSNTGKTRLASELVSGSDKKCVAVNDRTVNSPFKEKIPWHELKDQSNCTVIVEDLISLSRSQLDEIKSLLNYKAHHDHISPIVLITHSIVANGMSQLLPYVTRLIFSASPGCLSSLKRSLSYYGFSKEEINDHLKFFNSNIAPFKFFELDILSRKLSPYGSKMDPNPAYSSMDLAAISTAKHLLNHLPDPKMAETIFELILPHIPPANLDLHDLSVLMRRQKDGRRVRISLVDYIDHLASEQKTPKTDLIAFHSYIKRRVLIPESFIKNTKLENQT